uniref:Uncharacterized protein n=1 Tax=Proboscia inermis TaxID=420281 RepID=A0A6T8L644_9STRA|mmetsp:Transcript_36835/g.37136  ORF Transcript_36835/g.37136 Transcript_36835/m.37136 type:complete len:103 (+) Transcript_36835:256-564(+)
MGAFSPRNTKVWSYVDKEGCLKEEEGGNSHELGPEWIERAQSPIVNYSIMVSVDRRVERVIRYFHEKEIAFWGHIGYIKQVTFEILTRPHLAFPSTLYILVP